MGFVALDGFSAFGQAPISVSDNYVRLRKADAARLLAIASGDFTWLVLRDPVSSEIVQYVSDGDTVDVGNGLVDIPVSRQTSTGTRYNYSCQNILEYRVTTPVVSEIVQGQLAALGLSTT